jgi:hypothetical protein
LTVSATDIAKFESIDIRLGATPLLSASTDIFSGGKIQGDAILPSRWSGSALTPAGSGRAVRKAPSAIVLPGRIRIRFRLPPAGAPGGDPLLSAGRTGAADSVYLRGVGKGRYVLGLDHWGVGSVESAPLAISPGDTHTLVIEMGSLFTAQQIPPTTLRLVLDRQVVLSAEMSLYRVVPGEIVVGRNPLGMSTSQPEFRGEIISVRTLQPPPILTGPGPSN